MAPVPPKFKLGKDAAPARREDERRGWAQSAVLSGGCGTSAMQHGRNAWAESLRRAGWLTGREAGVIWHKPESGAARPGQRGRGGGAASRAAAQRTICLLSCRTFTFCAPARRGVAASRRHGQACAGRQADKGWQRDAGQADRRAAECQAGATRRAAAGRGSRSRTRICRGLGGRRRT